VQNVRFWHKAPRTKSISVLFNPSSAPYAHMFLPAMETSRGSVELKVPRSLLMLRLSKPLLQLGSEHSGTLGGYAPDH
jgi:hypothetical protein